MFPDYTSERINYGMIKTFLDIIVLAMLNGEPIYGYKLIGELHKAFGVLLSPGTLYPLLYHLKEEGFVEVKLFKRRKLYCLTGKGQVRVQLINASYQKHSKRVFSFIDMHLSKTLNKNNRMPKPLDKNEPLIEITENVDDFNVIVEYPNLDEKKNVVDVDQDKLRINMGLEGVDVIEVNLPSKVDEIEVKKKYVNGIARVRYT